MKKLSPEQIEQLYKFTRQHFVEWYDLQTELVDHLANAIEQQWEQNPNILFEEALQKEFKKFGVFGFQDIIQKRQAALGKKYDKIVWLHFKTFFTIPKIIGTITAVFLLKWILKQITSDYVILILAVVLFIFGLIAISRLRKKAKKHFKQTQRKWLLHDIIFGYSSMITIIILPIQWLIHLKNTSQYPDWKLWAVSLFIVSFVILEYIITILIPQKAEEYLKEIYPEYDLVESVTPQTRLSAR